MKLLKDRKFKAFVALIVTMVLVVSAQPKTSFGADMSELNKRLEGAVVMYIDSPNAYVNNVKTQIDPSNPNIYPVLRKNTVYVPARFAAEKFGAKVEWDGKTSTTRISLKDKSVRFTLKGSGKAVGIPAELVEGKMFVPLRAFTQGIGEENVLP